MFFDFFRSPYPERETTYDWLGETEVTAAIERAVDAIDPRLRLIRRYDTKLRPAVQHALRYVHELIAKIPGTLAIDRHGFGTDPQVQAFFASPSHMQSLFSQSRDIQGFFAQECDADRCHALMVMNLRERKTMGYAMEGEILRRDVMQTTVSFTAHRFFKPAPTEEGVRADLRERAFQHLITRAITTLAAIHERKQALNAQRVRLEAELRAAQTPTGAIDLLLDPEGGRRYRVIELERTLARIECELGDASASVATLDDQFHLVYRVLDTPETHCQVEQCKVRVDRMGIKVEDHAERGNDVTFANIRIGSTQQAGIIVSFPRQELMVVDNFVDRAVASLGI
jgi:hypothetical protein